MAISGLIGKSNDDFSHVSPDRLSEREKRRRIIEREGKYLDLAHKKSMPIELKILGGAVGGGLLGALVGGPLFHFGKKRIVAYTGEFSRDAARAGKNFIKGFFKKPKRVPNRNKDLNSTIKSILQSGKEFAASETSKGVAMMTAGLGMPISAATAGALAAGFEVGKSKKWKAQRLALMPQKERREYIARELGFWDKNKQKKEW